MQRPDGEPGIAAWLVALISFILPFAAVILALTGGWRVVHSEPGGWWLLAAACAFFVADLLIDLVWAHPSVSKSDQPDLNRRAAQLVGRVLVVEEAIQSGRGKVRVDDTLWPATGPDSPPGTKVKVTAATRTVLIVENAET